MKIPQVSLIKWFLPLSLVFLFTACGSGPQGEDAGEAEVSADDAGGGGFQSENLDLEKARNIFFMLPSPIETASLMRKAGAEFNGEILHAHKQASRYQTVKDKALNLGIYGADLSYSSIFERSQECIYYISACRKLAESIGVGEAFNSGLIERMDENINDKDSVFQIVSEAYWLVNSRLKENERANVSALIIAGGWIEGLYIGVQTVSETPNEQIMQRIAEQKYSLNDLVDLIDSYGEDEALSGVRADLTRLKAVFDEMEVEASEPTETTVNEDGVTTIGGSREITITQEQLERITEMVVSMRNAYVQA